MTLDRRALLAGGAAAIFAGFAGIARADIATQLRVVDDRVFIDAVVNGRPTNALLDSGAEMTVLDRAFATRLGISGGATATARGTGAATTEARIVRGVEVVVAGLRLRSPTVAVIDLADIARRVRLARIDVLIGRDLFDAARLAIDLRAGSVRAGPSIVPAGVRLPLVPQRGVETIPISIEGIPAQADFDLGNGGSVLIGAAFANRHRMLADGRPLATIPGGGIGGATLQTTLALRTLDLGGRRFTNVAAAIDTSPTAADANIGVRLLKRFGIVTDFAARSVWLDFRG